MFSPPRSSLRQRHRTPLFLLLLLTCAAIVFWQHFRLSPDYSALWLEEEQSSDAWVEQHQAGPEGMGKGGLVMFRQLRGAGESTETEEAGAKEGS